MLLLALQALFVVLIWQPKRERIASIERTDAVRTSEDVCHHLPDDSLPSEFVSTVVSTDPDFGSLYETVAREAENFDLDLQHFYPDQSNLDSAGVYLRQAWLLQAEGRYHDVSLFVTRLANLQTVVQPIVEEVTPSRIDETVTQLVQAQLTLVMFTLDGAPATLGDSRTTTYGTTTYGPASRDPFQPPMAEVDVHPTLRSLVLKGVVSRTDERSVATLTDISTGRRYRIREGDMLGALTVRRVGPREVHFGVSNAGRDSLVVLVLDRDGSR